MSSEHSPPSSHGFPSYRTPFDDERTLVEREHLVRVIEHHVPLMPHVARALLLVPRHLFVPFDQRPLSYDDGPLSIGFGQTISQPTVVAMMTQALELTRRDVVLEIGTGSGYQTAVLAEMAGQVESIELVEPLAARARETLSYLGYRNIRVHQGDGYQGLPQLAPFDAIIVTAAPPDLPGALWDQLGEGGRMVVPVGPHQAVQDLLLIRKRQGQAEQHNLGPVRFVPMVPGGSGPASGAE